MGVKGLWNHLLPAARKINLEDLEGQVLAIDVSIWIIQFINIIQRKNDYNVIDGFLRRICKLLFFGIKPVFVFDGSTPQIKKKCLMMRRNIRQRQQVNYNKAAEKLLHNIVKETLLNQIQNQNKLKSIENNKSEQQEARQNNQEEISSFDDEGIMRNLQQMSDKIQNQDYEQIDTQFHPVKKQDQSDEEDSQEVTQMQKFILEKYKSLLRENEIDEDIFVHLDIDEQYEIIEELERIKKDSARERFAEIQDDLQQFSEVQISNFINQIKEKKRQKEILIKASEAELNAMNQEQRQAYETQNQQNGAQNMRFIFRDNYGKQQPNFQASSYLPTKIVQVLEKAKLKRTRRGKGKNDIEKLLQDSENQANSDYISQQEVYGVSPIEYIRGQMTKIQKKLDIDELSDLEEKENLKFKEEEVQQFAIEKEKQLDCILEDMFGEGDDSEEKFMFGQNEKQEQNEFQFGNFNDENEEKNNFMLKEQYEQQLSNDFNDQIRVTDDENLSQKKQRDLIEFESQFIEQDKIDKEHSNGQSFSHLQSRDMKNFYIEQSTRQGGIGINSQVQNTQQKTEEKPASIVQYAYNRLIDVNKNLSHFRESESSPSVQAPQNN